MPKVMAADATASSLRAIHMAFQETEFDVYTSEDGVQALELIMRIEPDAVVVGLSLPRKDGYEIARFLKSEDRFHNVPLILLRDAFDPPDPDKLGALTYDGLLDKPFDSEELVRKIRDLLGAADIPDNLPEEPEPIAPTPSETPKSPAAPPPREELDSRIRDVVRREMGDLERELEKRLYSRLKSGEISRGEKKDEGES